MSTTETRRILLVEDEKTIRDAVAAYLEREGYWVTPAIDGRAALDAFATHRFDLVILDLMLPKISGEVVCREIRNHSDVPLIMLTAKGELDDRIMGLEMGADDYLIKPFSPRELIARVRALLRRVHTGDEPQRDKLVYGDLELDITAHQALLAGKDLDLTASEFKLLTTLARYPGRVYSRMELVEKVLGYDFEGYERTVDSHVKNLRAKLGDDPRNPRFIYTVHGVGYRFEPQNSAADSGNPGDSGDPGEPAGAAAEATEAGVALLAAGADATAAAATGAPRTEAPEPSALPGPQPAPKAKAAPAKKKE